VATLFHTPDRKRWFLVPSHVTLADGALRVRQLAGAERSVEEGIAAHEVDEAAAKAWLDSRFAAGFARAGAAFEKLVSDLRGRAELPQDLAHVRPTPSEAVERLLAWASERLHAAGPAPRDSAPRDPPPALAALGSALQTAAARVEARRREVTAERGPKKLQRVGFFAELRHGDPRGEKLSEARRPEPQLHEEPLVRYLQQAPVLVASPGPVRDVLAPDSGYIGTPSIHSDGVWCWPGDLAHYVATYHLALPAAFLAHAVARRWQHVPFDTSAVRL
jgi:hypothetical protein